MKVILGADHAGFKFKEELKKFLVKLGYEVDDLGTNSEESVDYPDFANKVAKKVVKEDARGILICGTGVGMAMAANKIKGIRAAVIHNDYTAEMSRTHNDANIACFGSRVLEIDEIKKLSKKFLETEFSEEERHIRRIIKLDSMK